jgi:uncharacterized caspase-like protein
VQTVRTYALGLRLLSVAAIFSGMPCMVLANMNERIALLIGVTDYRESPLLNPVDDVVAVAEALELRGWTATVLKNPTVSEAQNAIAQLADVSRNLDQSSAVMVYFSGHGFQLGSDSYMLFDGPSSDIGSIIGHSLSISDALDPFQDSDAAKLILIDACRNDPFGPESVASASAGLTQIEAPQNSVIGFATAPYRVAYDGGNNTDGLGPYASSVVAALGTSQDSDDFFRSVRRGTIIATEGGQVPWETSSLLQNVNLGQIGSEPQQTPDAPMPSRLTEQTASLTTFNRQPTDTEDFPAQVASFLEDGVRASALEDILTWNGRQATEQDREDFIATIRHDLAASRPGIFLGNYGIRMLSSDYGLNPACRSNGELDFNCSDSDRDLFLPLNPEFAYRVNKAAFDLGGRTDGLAMMYRDGIFVPQSYVKAYDVFLDARGRTDGGHRLDEYFEVDVNVMTQAMLNKLGADLEEDGDFGAGSCAALRTLVSGGDCGRIPSREDIEQLAALLS